MNNEQLKKYKKDLQNRYLIFVDLNTLKKVYKDLLLFNIIYVDMEYDLQLDIIANHLMFIIKKYKYKYA